MHMPSVTADGFAVLAFAAAALAFQMIRLRRSGTTIFNGGILLAVGLLVGATLPILARLPWAEFAEEAFDQTIATIHLLEVTYVILTL
jgi:hypothetical protein